MVEWLTFGAILLIGFAIEIRLLNIRTELRHIDYTLRRFHKTPWDEED